MNLYILHINPDYEDWLLNKKLHRLNKPSTTYSSGSQLWYQNGLRHRDDGPAVIFARGEQFWLLNGKEFSEEDFLKEITKLREHK